jgi:ribosome-binding protein aMBF1 (putative translation factor)
MQRIRCVLLLQQSDLSNESVAVVNKKKFLKELGSHIRNLRMERGLTQASLSSKMDKDTQSLQRVESGSINPSLFYLYELATALETDLKEIVDLDV